MSNLTVLERNIIHGLDSEDAETMFLRLRESMSVLAAEEHAYGWRDAALQLRPMVSAAEALHDGVDHGVFAYIAERFYQSAKSSDKTVRLT